MEINKLRIPLGIILGWIIILFGVFLFGNFIYRGQSLTMHILPLMGHFDTFMIGFFQLLDQPYTISLFVEFSAENVSQSSASAIFFGPDVWPIVVTWFVAGFTTGVFAKGLKRGVLSALGLFIIYFFLWLIFGFFAAADFGTIFLQDIGLTLGKLFSCLLFILPGAVLGGGISGPYLQS